MRSLTPKEQLRLWVAGDSRCPNTHNECCPDFSCCDPKLLAPLARRQAFVQAKGAERNKMLMGFLGGFTDTLDADVHLAGRIEDE